MNTVIIDIDDLEHARPSKRIRIPQHAIAQSRDVSSDVQLAACLQQMEYENACKCTSRDAEIARALQLSEGDMPAMFSLAPTSVIVNDQSDQLKCAKKMLRNADSNCSHSFNIAKIVTSDASKTFELTPVSIKLYLDDAVAVVVRLNPHAKLVSIFADRNVSCALCRLTGLKQTYDSELADRFNLHRALPSPCVFDRSLAERTTVLAAIRGSNGVLRINPRNAIKVGNALQLHLNHDHIASSPSTRFPVECDSAQTLRLRRPDGLLGSPVVLVKNFNCDRGVLLAQLTGLKEMVEMAPEARKIINSNVRNELDSHDKAKRTFTTEVRRASDRVLAIGEEIVQSDAEAKAALSHRTEYASTAVLVYDKSTTLPRHVDGCGSWVVLFSFGLTVDFFAGERTFQFESGDALIFNGSSEHAVTHGIDRVHSKATLHGKAKTLPKELRYLSKKRASFQARQSDG